MLIHWIWYSQRGDMNERQKITLLERFPDAEDIFRAGPEALSGCPASLRDKELDNAEKVLARCVKSHVHIVTWNDDFYPRLLRSIPDPPVVLYFRGKLPQMPKTAAVGVVGTRKASPYGLEAAQRLGYQIAQCGGIVVTGMAAGVDSMAAQGALQGKGRVIGVLGCGPDRVYPASSGELYKKVLEDGCILSEYPPGSPPSGWHFPRRNRILSGICDGVAVVEAPEKSGALITARYAMEQGRDVYAVPGNLGVSACAGSNALLRDGGAVVTCGWDILSEYADKYPGKLCRNDTSEPVIQNNPAKEPEKEKAVDKAAKPPYSDLSKLSANERALYTLLDGAGRPVDEVLAQANLPTAAALSALTTLAIKGLTRTLPGGRIARI